MRFVHSFLALALVLTLAASSYAGDGKGKKNQPVSGRVTAVDKDNGSITLKVQPKAKKGAATAAPATEQTFKVTTATKYNSASGKKGAVQATTATLDDVKVGGAVVVVHTGDTATQVTIQLGKTKKQK
jgi:hypothetical protein